MGGRSAGGALMRLIARSIKDQNDYRNGKLRFSSGLWRFVGTNIGKPLDNGLLPTGKCHSTGLDMELVSCRAVFCPNPDMDGHYPRITDPPKDLAWHVPDFVCRKCQYRGKRGEDRIPFPYCKWAKEQRSK